MKTRRPNAVLTAALAVGVMTACAKPAIPHPNPDQDLIVLLPDADSGTVGRATVSNSRRRVELTADRDSTAVDD